METLVWLRVPGDIVFAVGAVFLALYALRLLRRPAAQRTPGAGRAGRGRVIRGRAGRWPALPL